MVSFLKDLLSVGLSKAGVIFFGLAQTIVIARWLGPELNGTMATLLVYPTLFMAIGSLGIRQSTAYYTGKNSFPDDQIKSAVLQIWIVSSIFTLLVCYALIKWFSESGDDEFYIILAIVPIPFSLFSTYISGIFLGKNEIRYFNKINWLPSLFILVATIFFVIILDLSLVGALLALIMGPLGMTIILLFKHELLKYFSFKVEIKIIKLFLSLGIVYALSLFVINLNYKVDVILIDKFSSAYEVGIYSKGSALIQYLWQIPMLLSTIIFARSASSKDQKQFSLKVCQLLRISALVISIGCLLLGILAPWIINLLFGEEFIPSASVLLYLIPGVLLLTIFKVLNMDLAGRGKPWIAMKAMVPSLIINVILNVLWIPTYGANGAAVASTISYTAAAIIFLWIYSKEISIPIKIILLYRKEDFIFISIIYQKLKLKIT